VQWLTARLCLLLLPVVSLCSVETVEDLLRGIEGGEAHESEMQHRQERGRMSREHGLKMSLPLLLLLLLPLLVV